MHLVLHGHVRCLLQASLVTDLDTSGITLTLWACIFLRSIPSFIDGTMFKAPYITDDPPVPDIPVIDITKAALTELELQDHLSRLLTTSTLYETHEVELKKIKRQNVSQLDTTDGPTYAHVIDILL